MIILKRVKMVRRKISVDYGRISYSQVLMTSMIDDDGLYDFDSSRSIILSYIYLSYTVGIFVEYADTKEPLKTVKVEVAEQQKKSRYAPTYLYRST